MKSELGLSGLKSYLADKNGRFWVNGVLYELTKLAVELPKGSSALPLAIRIYTVKFSKVIKSFRLCYQVLLRTTHNSIQLMSLWTPLPLLLHWTFRPQVHVSLFERWIHTDFIKLNDNKSGFFVATSPYHKGRMPTVPSLADNKFIGFHDAIGNWRVLFNSHFAKFNIPARQYFANTSFVIPALFSTRLESGNGLSFSCKCDWYTQVTMRLQLEANWVYQSLMYDHVTLCLHQLHWLPVHSRIPFKNWQCISPHLLER